MKHKILSFFLVFWVGLYLSEDITQLIFTKEKVKIEDVEGGEECRENNELKEKDFKFYQLPSETEASWVIPFRNFPSVKQLSLNLFVTKKEPLYVLYQTYIFYH